MFKKVLSTMMVVSTLALMLGCSNPPGGNNSSGSSSSSTGFVITYTYYSISTNLVGTYGKTANTNDIAYPTLFPIAFSNQIITATGSTVSNVIVVSNELTNNVFDCFITNSHNFTNYSSGSITNWILLVNVAFQIYSVNSTVSTNCYFLQSHHKKKPFFPKILS